MPWVSAVEVSITKPRSVCKRWWELALCITVAAERRPDSAHSSWLHGSRCHSIAEWVVGDITKDVREL